MPLSVHWSRRSPATGHAERGFFMPGPWLRDGSAEQRAAAIQVARILPREPAMTITVPWVAIEVVRFLAGCAVVGSVIGLIIGLLLPEVSDGAD